MTQRLLKVVLYITNLSGLMDIDGTALFHGGSNEYILLQKWFCSTFYRFIFFFKFLLLQYLLQESLQNSTNYICDSNSTAQTWEHLRGHTSLLISVIQERQVVWIHCAGFSFSCQFCCRPYSSGEKSVDLTREATAGGLHQHELCC